LALFIEARTSISVPSTEKCSPESDADRPSVGDAQKPIDDLPLAAIAVAVVLEADELAKAWLGGPFARPDAGAVSGHPIGHLGALVSMARNSRVKD
jgi:hypothetical protein